PWRTRGVIRYGGGRTTLEASIQSANHLTPADRVRGSLRLARGGWLVAGGPWLVAGGRCDQNDD
ncbi:MAG: hypothetical protein ACK535_01630, partial [Cyanobacteriota bacterium]